MNWCYRLNRSLRSRLNVRSAWDVAQGPDGIDPRHLAVWIQGSGFNPALVASNDQTLSGSAFVKALVGDRLDQLGGHTRQYATGLVARLLRRFEGPSAGGWWVSGLVPLNDWAPMAWGCFQPETPRWCQDQFGPREYEHPLKVAGRSFWLSVPSADAEDTDGLRGEFWMRWPA